MKLIELYACDKCDDIAIVWKDNTGLINFTQCLCVTIKGAK